MIDLARPEWLWLLPLPLAVPVVARRLPTRAAEPLATPTALAALTTRRAGRLRPVLVWLAWACLVLAACGPRWGTGEPDGVARGHDWVWLLDCSASMHAADTQAGTRLDSALAMLRQVPARLRATPGERMGLVVFGARAEVRLPPTGDAELWEFALDELDLTVAPEATRLRPGDPSGTRFGAAIRAGLTLQDSAGLPLNLVLLSDGDDPVPDREWATAVTEARRQGTPVHTVGLGQDAPSPVYRRCEWLTVATPAGPERVLTRLDEGTLQSIAVESRGRYAPARERVPELAPLLDEWVADEPPERAESPVAARQGQAHWFLLAAATLFLATRLEPPKIAD